MKLLVGLILLLALIWAVTLWMAARQEAQARAEYPPLGAFVTVNGTRVHYLQEGTGPDVVLIHGASGNLRDFSFDLMGRLSDRYRVTAFDRPGLGYTERMDAGGASIFQQAELLSAASEQLGLDRPLLVGHSYGGAVVLAWATREGDGPAAPAALVVLAGASNPWDTGLSTYYKVLSHPILGPVVIPFITAWVPDSVVTDAIAGIFAPQDTPEGYDAYIGAGLTLQRRSLRENALQRASLLEEITAMVPDYATLDLPVEILHGTADDTVGLEIHSEPLSRQIDGANLVVMEGVGHSPHHAEPGTVTDAIDRAAERAGLR